MEYVQDFAINRFQREAVHDYITEKLKVEVIDRAFSGSDIKDLAEAKKIIDAIFKNMETEFCSKPETKVINEME